MEPDDAAGPYATWMNDSEVTRFLESRFTIYAPEALRAYIEELRQQPSVHFFAIVLSDSDRHIGNIKLGPIDEHHKTGDIGLLIGERDCWGHGYATEAISLLATLAFGELGLVKLTAGAYAGNVGSIRAFERAGFHVEATRRRHYECEGQRVDGVLLARFRDDEQ
jgi:RimJ/RimL family protein N-acetyltransferase